MVAFALINFVPSVIALFLLGTLFSQGPSKAVLGATICTVAAQCVAAGFATAHVGRGVGVGIAVAAMLAAIELSVVVFVMINDHNHRSAGSQRTASK